MVDGSSVYTRVTKVLAPRENFIVKIASLDLNDIENVWRMWKGRLIKRFSRTEIPGGTWGSCGSLRMIGILGRTYTEAELWTACVEEWNAIEQDKIDGLIRTMPRHIQSVIQAEGGQLKW